MDIAKQDIAAVIRISGQTWVVTQSGQWLPADEVTTSLDSFDIITLTQSQVDLTGEQPQVFISGNWLTLPSQVIDSLVAANIENQQQSSNEQQSTNQQVSNQQGSNFFYQFIQRDADETIADSGFDTTPDDDQNNNEEETNSAGSNNSVLLPELSITIADGGDEWINQFETPSTDLFGQAKYANNGQALTVILTDANGKTITLNTTAQNQAWRIDDIDLSALAEGQIIADIMLTNPIVNADIDAQDTSVKDTIAEITVNIEKAELSDNNQQLTTFSGDVVNIQNGQTVVVTLSSADGAVISSTETTVIDGQWQVENVNTTALADSNYLITVSSNDLAGNPASAERFALKDTTAEITVTINENCTTEGETYDILGTVNDVEDGNLVDVTVRDENGLSKTFQALVQNGAYALLDVDLTGLADGDMQVTATVSDFVGNQATAENSFVFDSLAQLTININDTSDQVINGVEDNAVQITGTAVGVDDGQTVFIILQDAAGNSLELAATVSDEAWQLDGVDISSLENGTITANASTQDLNCNPATATDSAEHDKLADISVTTNKILTEEGATYQFSGLVTDIEDGNTVTLTLSDKNGQSQVITALVINGAYSTDIINLELADGPITVDVNTQDNAGNIATASDNFDYDNTAAITVDIDTGSDEVINLAESTNRTLFGDVVDVEDGQQVSITVTDENNQALTFTATIVNGQWQVENADLSSLVDGTLTITSTVTDLNNNQAQASTTTTKDTVATVTIEIDSGSDNLLNKNEVLATNISGTTSGVEDGQFVVVTLTDTDNNALDFRAEVINGRWSLSDLDLTTLSEGPITAEATTTDIAGNIAQATDTVFKDTASNITVDLVEQCHDGIEIIDLFGSVENVEDGAPVVIIITDAAGNELRFDTTSNNGAWAFTDANLAGLNDGELNIRAYTTDKSGNIVSNDVTFVKDTVAEITIDVETGNDEVINSAETPTTTISGTVSNVEDGQTVTLTVQDINGKQISFETTVMAGLWSVSDANLSILAEGELSFSATVADQSCNTAKATADHIKDTLADINITVESNGDNLINSNEVGAVTLYGDATNIENGQTVTVTVTDANGDSQQYTTTVNNQRWELSDLDFTAFAEGELDFTVEATDIAGNQATNTTEVFKDTLSTVSMQVLTNGDDILNELEVNPATFGGVANDIETGQAVEITVTDSTGTTLTFNTVVRNGYFIIDDGDLSGLADGDLTFTATTTDKNGNPATATNTIVKNTAPVEITIDIDTIQDNVINDVESPVVDIIGTTVNVEDGATVSVTLTDINGDQLTFSATVFNNQWRLDDIDTRFLVDGTIIGNATVTNSVGNSGSAQEIVGKDVVADITLMLNDSDQVINQTESLENNFSGTVTDVEDGQTVTLTLTDKNGLTVSAVTTIVNGAWALGDLDLSGLADGDITAQVATNDVAENPTENSITFVKDTTATISITVDDADQVINKAEQMTVNVGGTTTGIEAGQTVTISVTDSNGFTRTGETTLVNGAWSLSDVDITDLAEGELVVTVTSTDVAGNEATNTTSVVKDTLASLTIEVDSGPDNLLNAREIDAVEISGLANNIEDGQQVTITITDSDNIVQSYVAIVENGTWTLGQLDLSSFAEGPLQFDVQGSDIAGNPANADTEVFKDTLSVISMQIKHNGDDILNSDEVDPAVFGGVANDIETGQPVVIKVTDENGQSLTFNTTVKNGFFVIEDGDLSGLADGTLTFNATSIDSNGNVTTATNTVVKNTAPVEITIDIDTIQDNTINDAESPMVDITGTVDNVEDGQTVTVVLTDAAGNMITRTATVNGGVWAINNVDTQSLVDGDVTGTATVKNVAGNSGNANEVVQKDVVADITVQLNDADQVINTTESTTNSLSGTVNNVEDGQTVSLILTDKNGNTVETTALVTNGMWNVDNLDLTTLADGDITAEVNVSDVAENPASNSITFNKDTVATITVNVLDDDQVINNAEQASVDLNGLVSGVEEGQTVTLSITDSQNRTLEFTTTVANSAWALDNLDLSVFAQGDLTVTATTTDVAGNEASNTTTVVKDTLASVTIDVDHGGDNSLNAAEVSAVGISGLANNIEDGQTVTILLTDSDGVTQTYSATVANGEWSLGDVDLSAFAEGPLQFDVSANDVAGNPATTDTNVFKDTLSSISVQIQTNGDGILNSDEVFTTIFGGVANDIETGQPVRVTVTDEAGNSQVFNTTARDGFYLIEDTDLSALLDGTLTFTAESIDRNGNPATATNTVIKDTAPVEISIDIDTVQDDTINAAEAPTVRVSGTTDAENGQVVTVVLSDSDGNEITLTTTVVNGEWLLENVDTRFLVDGDITGTASVENRAGNSGEATDIVDKDVVAQITLALNDSDLPDQVINENEVTANNSFSGSVTDIEDGQVVTLNFVDRNGNTATVTTTVINGAWSLDNVDLSNLVDGQIEAKVQVADQPENPASDTLIFTKDTLAKIVTEVLDIDQLINAAEQNSVNLGGAVLGIQNGQTVTVTVTDGNTSQTFSPVVVNGYWSVNGVDFSSFNDGDVTVTATAQDIAGNNATNSTTVEKDTLAEITIAVATGDDNVINAIEAPSTLLSGTVNNIEDGRIATITVSDQNGRELTFTAVITGGTWQYTANLTSLADGPLSYEVSASDTAGNPANATTNTGKDTLADIAVEILSGDDNFLVNNELNNVVIRGKVTNIEAGQTVTLLVMGANGESTSITAQVQSDLSYETEAIDLSSWADGEITVTANSEDIAGNAVSSTDDAIIDTTVSIDIDTGTGFDLAAFRAGELTSMNGTTDAEAGQLVQIALYDGGQTLYFTGVVGDNGTWTVNNINVSTLNKATAWQLTATVTDLAGNTATDDMPTLDVIQTQELYELVLDVAEQTSDTSALNINNAELSLANIQEALAALTYEGGNAVRVEVADDGQSLNVVREDGSNTIAMTIELIPNAIRVTTFTAFDQPVDSLLTTTVLIEALQTDEDGTSELVIVPTYINIYDTPPFSRDDEITVVEDETSNGSLTGNDYTIEGPLVVTQIELDGKTYTIASGSPAVVTLSYGELTVNSNGTWQFQASDNLDHNTPQNFSFDYTVMDKDGSLDTATATVNIEDGAAGFMDNQNLTLAEPDYDQVLNRDINFTIFAGSDTLKPESIAFNEVTAARLNALGLTSDGEKLVFEFSNNNKTLTATAGGSTIITIDLSAVNNGDDLAATANFMQQGPIDHLVSEQIELLLTVTANDLDGTAISQGDATITIDDGNNARFDGITKVTLDENLLDQGTQTATGQLSTLVGSDQIVEVIFSAQNEQPSLTSNGEQIIYDLSSDGKTIIGHTGDVNDPVFQVALSNSFNSTTDSLGENYTVTLYRALDQDVTDAINLKIEMTDFDGDKVTSNLDITIIDNNDIDEDIPTLNVSEIPKDGSIYSNIDSGTITITAEFDAVTAIDFNFNNGNPVLDSQGNPLTQNGQAITWFNLGNGTAQGRLSNGTVVFETTLPNEFNLAPGESGSALISFELFGAIDHLNNQDLQLAIDVPIAVIDADGSRINNDVIVNVDDGLAPEITTPGIPNSIVDEFNLNTENSISSTGNFTLAKGSDAIIEIALADGFTLEGITKNGQAVTLAETTDSNGWYIATAQGSEVFRIRFNTDGSYEYIQKQALDHQSGEGTNQLDINFEIQAIDADGDKSANQDLTVSIKDDVPVSIDTDITFSEGDDLSLQLLDGVKQGADGATVTQVTYLGVNYSAGDTIELKNGNDIYGSLTINSDGSVTINTDVFAAETNLYQDTISYQVTDADGDNVTNNLNLNIQDSKGRIVFIQPQGNEDSEISVELAAYPGDLDSGDEITEIKISVDSLNGGSLILLGANGSTIDLPVVDGFVVISGDNLRIIEEPITLPNGSVAPAGAALPNGILLFQGAENTSDAIANQQVSLDVDVVITDPNGSRTINSDIPIIINSVADMPIWDDSSEYTYLSEEDGAPIELNLLANLQDTDGSEVLTYRIENIEQGLILKANGQLINNGDILTTAQIESLTAQGATNLAGSFTFDITAIATEKDNNDVAEQDAKTITIDLQPVADAPDVIIANARTDEDVAINAKQLVVGQLNDADGSESLFYEFTVPAGWSMQALNGANVEDLGNGTYSVSREDVLAGNIELLPETDTSSFNNNFVVSVVAVSYESVVDGVPIKDGAESARSESKDLNVTVTGVIDPPAIETGANWAYDDNAMLITNTGTFNEDELIALDFKVVTSDNDGSEIINLLVSNLPDGVTIVDASGNPVTLEIVRAENGKPVYSVSAQDLQNLFLKPSTDFSGTGIDFNITMVTTEPDGDSGEFRMDVNIAMTPVLDSNASNLATASSGTEDLAAVLNLNPATADIDNSEQITGAVINGIPDDVILLLDGSEIEFTGALDLATLADGDLAGFLASGRLAILAPQDASGEYVIDVTYTVIDTSDNGNTTPVDIATTSTVTIAPDFDKEIEIDGERSELVATSTETLEGINGRLDLTGAMNFNEADIDGSETIDYIVLILPEGEGFYVDYPGALPDGDGRWIIPLDAGTTTDNVDVVDVLNGVTLVSDNPTDGPIEITVAAKVADLSDDDAIFGTLNVNFAQGANDSAAGTIDDIQNTIIDAIEDQTISFAGHFNNNFVDDSAGNNNDQVSFRVLASDLPAGVTLSGTGIEVIHDASGQVVIEYLFTQDALDSITLSSAGADFAGTLNLPIRVISVDPISGDTTIDDSQLITIDVSPDADGATATGDISQMEEDTPQAIGIALGFIDADLSPTTGGSENVLIDNENPDNNLTITLLDGGTLNDPSGLFILQAGSTDTWIFTGTEQSQLSSALAEISVTPPAHVAGNGLVRLQINGTVIDTAELSTGIVTDTDSFSTTISLDITAVTDNANLTTSYIEGDEDSFISLAALDAEFIDQDGSEVMYLSIAGVPDGAILALDNGDGSFSALPNNGLDGGTFKGAATYNWGVTQAQLASGDLVIIPAEDFNGDIPLTLQAITKDVEPGQYLTTTSNFVVGVRPIGDGVDLIRAPNSNYAANEDETVTIDIAAISEDANDDEQIQLTVKIASDSDDSALVGLEGAFIDVGGARMNFVSDGAGGFVATLVVASNQIQNFDFNAGHLAWGNLNMQVDVASIDTATVNGVQMSDTSDVQSTNFSLTLQPEVDAPVWLSNDDITVTDPDNIPLGLSLELQNPAENETGYLVISGVPEGLSLNAGSKDGADWIVDLADVEGLQLLGAQAGDNFTLILTPYSELNGETEVGAVQDIDITVTDNSGIGRANSDYDVPQYYMANNTDQADLSPSQLQSMLDKQTTDSNNHAIREYTTPTYNANGHFEQDIMKVMDSMDSVE